MNNKVLLYSIGNYIQYLVINYNEKEKKFLSDFIKLKKNTYIYIYIYIYTHTHTHIYV